MVMASERVRPLAMTHLPEVVFVVSLEPFFQTGFILAEFRPRISREETVANDTVTFL
jgi:hypothetical protein